MTPITLTERGRLIGVAKLHDADPEMCFKDARTITRTNDGWHVDLEKPK